MKTRPGSASKRPLDLGVGAAHDIMDARGHLARGGSGREGSRRLARAELRRRGRRLQVARRDLAAAHAELEKQVARLQPNDLLRWIGDQRDPKLGSGLSVGTVIRGLLQHDAYHQGQIMVLRRAAEPARFTTHKRT